MIASILCVIIFPISSEANTLAKRAAEADDNPEECCDAKNVGGVDYIKVLYVGEVPEKCLTDCIYEKKNMPGKRYCFKRGSLAVHCINESEGGPTGGEHSEGGSNAALGLFEYPNVQIRNDNDYNKYDVTGFVQYAGCNHDSYKLKANVYSYTLISRGLCLITMITAEVHNTDTGKREYCYAYESAGTSYSQFSIVLRGSPPHCEVVRLANRIHGKKSSSERAIRDGSKE